jgi:ADP-ribose pyrophosphatase
MKKCIKSQSVYAGKVLDVNVEEHEMPDGRQSTFEIIRHPGGAAVLPELPGGRLLLIKQFRPAIGDMIYEIPAGRLEPGEAPDLCAGRELIEETGYRAGEMHLLGSFWSTVGFCDERIHLYLGRELNEVKQQLEPDEHIELCPLSIESAMHMLAAGEIQDSKTQIALMHYQRRFWEQNK